MAIQFCNTTIFDFVFSSFRRANNQKDPNETKLTELEKQFSNISVNRSIISPLPKKKQKQWFNAQKLAHDDFLFSPHFLLRHSNLKQYRLYKVVFVLSHRKQTFHMQITSNNPMLSSEYSIFLLSQLQQSSVLTTAIFLFIIYALKNRLILLMDANPK